jgi:hypothetical protein
MEKSNSDHGINYSGKVVLHKKLFKLARFPVKLEVRLWDIDNSRVVASKTMEVSLLPVDWFFDSQDLHGNLSGQRFFAEAILSDSCGLCLWGEAWGRAGRLYALSPGVKSDIIIAGFVC